MSFKYKNKFISKIVVLLIIISTVLGEFTFSSDLYHDNAYVASAGRQYLPSGKLDVFQYPEQTPVGNLKYDKNGLPYQVLDDGKIIRNVSNIASYILFKGGIKSIEQIDSVVIDKNELSLSTTQKAALEYCLKNLKTVEYNGITADILVYDYQYIYNEHIIDPPFGSSVSQYIWVRVLSYLYDVTGDISYKDMLIRAMNAFRIPVEYGGLMYKFEDGGIWFEEIAGTNPTHILNGHLIAANVLYKISIKYNLEEFKKLAEKAINTAEDRLDIFDLDNWSRYDMAWKLYENQFKIEFEPFVKGVDESQAFAVGSVETYREKESLKYFINTNDTDAFQGALRLAGMGWSSVENVNGESGRWVIPSKYIYTDYQQKFWENNIQSLMVLEFPDSELPYEKEGDFGLKIRYYAKFPGRLTISLRDNSHGDDYKYNKSVSFDINQTDKWEDLSFTIDKKYFSGYVGSNYHATHIELLSNAAALISSNKFKQLSEKFYKYYENSFADCPPIDVRGIDTLWGRAINLNQYNNTVITDLSGLFEKEEPYNVEKLIDGNINSYTATEYNIREASLSIKLKDRAVIDSVKLYPYSNEIYFGAYKVKVYDKGKLTFEEQITTPKNILNNLGFVFNRFDKIVIGDEIQITFMDYKGQERFVLNELSIYGSYDRVLGIKLLDEILNGEEDEFSKVIKIGSFVTDYFNTGFPESGDFKSVLKQKIAGCGERSQVMMYLLAEAGVKSRFINLYNMPQIGDGHSLIEVFVANKWVYYDPSYAYFIAVPRNIMSTYATSLENKYRMKNEEYILASLDDLSAHPEWIEKYAMHYSFIPWTVKEREETFANHKLPSFPLGQYTSPNTVAMANPKGPAGKDYITSFPIYIDNKGIKYGEVDNSFSDLVRIGVPSGISYIGLADWNVKWEFLFDKTKDMSRKWRVEIYPQMVSSDTFLLTLKLNNCSSEGKKEFKIRPTELNGKPIIFEIERDKEDNFSIEVYHNEQGFMNVDAIKVIPINTLNN